MFTICISWRVLCQFGLTQNQNESFVVKADLLFLFVNLVKRGSTWKKVIFGIIKRKMWSKCYCRKEKQFTTIKCKVQNNRKIQETQTSVASTTKAEQER